MKRKESCLSFTLVISFLIVGVAPAEDRDDLLRNHDMSGREFKRVEIGDRIVYFHQRTVNGATVEKDFIVYQFDRDTNELLDKKVHWRSDLRDDAVPVIARDQAESMAEGEVQFARPYIISPDSDVFPLDPTPENPCWVVRSIRNGKPVVTIIDAVTGRHLGYGIPPPQTTGFAMSGPQYQEPCGGAWTSWYTNAEEWFEYMGYPTATAHWPTQDEIRSHVQSTETAVFYEIGHSHGTYGLLFCSGCPDGYYWEDTMAEDIETWITGYSKMPFTFLASCYGMCDVGPGTLSYAFRKASSRNTATVGYCDMSEWYCSDCWGYSLVWQTELFTNMANGDAVKEAYDKALAASPMCAPTEGLCMRFAGDESFAIVPVVPRVSNNDVPDPPPGEPGYDKIRYISFVPGSPGMQTALRVTLTTMPPPFGAFSGLKMWVGNPQTKCENAGIIDPPCPPVPGLPPDFQSARLQCTPNCMDYGLVGALHVTDDEIVPLGVYDVQAINCAADFGNEADYSDPLTINTSKWGDLVSDCTIVPCGPPDGIGNVTTDVTAVLDKYKNLPFAVMKSRADLDWNQPDWLINISDVTFCLDAFLGSTYPPAGWAGPGGCP